MEELGRQIDTLSNKLTEMRLEFWTTYTLFSWQWWILIASCIGTIILCMLLIRRTNLLKVIAYIGLFYILNQNLDEWATSLDWYDYRMQEEPINPTMLTANLFVIPGIMAIIYERFGGWKRYCIGICAYSGFLAYIAMPLMKMANIYTDKVWNGHLSFMSLIIMSVLCKVIVDAAVRYQFQTPRKKVKSSVIDMTYVSQKFLGRRRGRIT